MYLKIATQAQAPNINKGTLIEKKKFTWGQRFSLSKRSKNMIIQIFLMVNNSIKLSFYIRISANAKLCD